MKRQSSPVIFHVETRYDKKGRPSIVRYATHSNKGKEYGKKDQSPSVQAPPQETDFTGFGDPPEQEQASVLETLPGTGEVT